MHGDSSGPTSLAEVEADDKPSLHPNAHDFLTITPAHKAHRTLHSENIGTTFFAKTKLAAEREFGRPQNKHNISARPLSFVRLSPFLDRFPLQVLA